MSDKTTPQPGQAHDAFDRNVVTGHLANHAIAELPEIGTVTGEEAARLTGLAPVAHDSGTLRGKRAIADGHCAVRHVMFQAGLVASHHNPTMKAFADRLRTAGKPHKVVITAVARKLITIANALCKSLQIWVAPMT
ncbi:MULTISPECIES: transposase [unclassified Yoonia]|uniref:transposase n=1 Tax=unclassified Yoonia TaxID=2629118 RepID=UPI002AFEE0CD|nr:MULTISPECIES: transposase [unclassified Yoonia]